MMRFKHGTLAMLIAAMALTPAMAQLGARWRAQRGEQAGGQAVPGARDLAYGQDALQRLNFWPARAAHAPLVIFVHGGGWKRGDRNNATGAAKVSDWLGQGYAVASINYRLVPAATVEDQASDVAHAVAWLKGQAGMLGIDPARIVLVGHSAGAHLVALVGTDMRYFAQAGLRADAVRGIIALDGAAYDVPRQIASGNSFMHDTYEQAFGTDPGRQRALSPTLQAAAPNAPSFLILHVQRQDGIAQSQALAAALRSAGTPVEIQGFEGRGLIGHMQINRKLGEPDYPATPVVDAWLKRVMG